MIETYDLVIVGAGPSGLACALDAQRLGLDYLVVEKGTVVNTIVGFPTFMTFFSTPDLLELGDMPFTSPNFRPSRVEAVEYYRGVVRKRGLRVSLRNAVVGVQRESDGRFLVEAEQGTYRARSLVLATGYFDNTNRLNVPGEELPHVHHYYREPFEFIGAKTVVIGGRNSAVEVALDLYRHGADVTLIHRGDAFGSGVKYWVRPDIENRVSRGEIAMRWSSEVVEIRPKSILVRDNVSGSVSEIACDALFAMIGYRPDVRLMQKCGVEYDPETLIPTFDPETLETNISNLFLAGSISCGCKTWEVFIENGRAHAALVMKEIGRRFTAGHGAPATADGE